MSILSRLFRKAPRRSRLEEFLSELTQSAIRSASLKGHDEEMRVATAISLLVLAASYRFASGLAVSVAELSATIGAQKRPMGLLFDVAAFEVAAFAHHALLAPFMAAHESDDFDQDEPDDPYFVVLRSAAHLSSSILQKFTDFGLPEEFLVNRALSYSLRERRSAPATQFEGILSSAIEGLSPKAGLRGPMSLDLGIGLGLKASIPAFCTHTMPALSVAARQAFDNADKLGLADS
jgi:hypothetical protein